MRKHPHPIALAAILMTPLLQGAGAPLGEVVPGTIYVNCEYRLAAEFPTPPMVRDFTYTIAGRSAPAREFYVDHNGGKLSVTVVHFANGPEVDQALIDAAGATFRPRGEVRYEFEVSYDVPNIPGRQFAIALPDGRLLRAHVYMAENRLYLTEATALATDVPAFKFEESVSLIDENGTDLDTNPVTETNTFGSPAGLPSRQYDCG